MNGIGAMRGTSDIIGLLPGGRLLAVEVKGPGDKPNEDQLLFIDKVNEQGGLAFIAKSLQHAQEQMRHVLFIA